MIDFEQLGLFYVGREAGQQAPLLLQSKHFTTHAVVMGMTGSTLRISDLGWKPDHAWARSEPGSLQVGRM